MKTLFVSVGGSHQPILTSIRTISPDRVVFLCSNGPKGSKSQVIGQGNPCEIRQGSEVIAKLPNIPIQSGLGDRFDPTTDLWLIEDPDDIAECYRQAMHAIAACVADHVELCADYTGGTKTMSMALAMAALDCNVKLYVTTATRNNLQRVESGETTEPVAVQEVRAQRFIEQALPPLLLYFNYSSAVAELETQMATLYLPQELKRRFRELLAVCRGFDAWDRFDHRAAMEYLQPFTGLPTLKQLFLQLKRTAHSRSLIDSDFNSSNIMKGHGYEIVEDLLLNAERRAAQSRYDDAVGRLYRAIELLAQLRLKLAYNLLTGDINVNLLPETLQPKYEAMRFEGGKIQIPLERSYELLLAFGNDPLGTLFGEYKNRIRDALKVRNHSLFAHGFQPITQADYTAFHSTIVGFIQAGIGAVVPSKDHRQPIQFPNTLIV